MINFCLQEMLFAPSTHSQIHAERKPSMSKNQKLLELERLLNKRKPLAVAFSGGVDSTFLLAVAARILSGEVMAVTVASPLFPGREKAAAIELADRLNVRHLVLEHSDMSLTPFKDNPKDRCYICKKAFFGQIIEKLRELDVPFLAHGANLDDHDDYRPGLKAAQELQILSPLVEAGLTKSDIRSLSRDMGLPTWNKPSMACLATRIPYGTHITPDILSKIEAAEDALYALGFEGARVRYHGPVARIEFRSEDLSRTLASGTRQEIIRRVRSAGFDHVAVDLEGYTQGSMNRAILP